MLPDPPPDATAVEPVARAAGDPAVHRPIHQSPDRRGDKEHEGKSYAHGHDRDPDGEVIPAQQRRGTDCASGQCPPDDGLAALSGVWSRYALAKLPYIRATETRETAATGSVLLEPATPVSVLPPLLDRLARGPAVERAARHLDQLLARERASLSDLVGQDRIEETQPAAARAWVRPLVSLIFCQRSRLTPAAAVRVGAQTRRHAGDFAVSTLVVHKVDRSLTTRRSDGDG